MCCRVRNNLKEKIFPPYIYLFLKLILSQFLTSRNSWHSPANSSHNIPHPSAHQIQYYVEQLEFSYRKKTLILPQKNVNINTNNWGEKK